MASILVPRKRPSVRPFGVPVLNRDSPQAQGLVAAGINFSGRPYDLTGNADVSFNSGAAQVVNPRLQIGQAVGGQSNNRYIDISNFSTFSALFGSEATIAIWLQNDSDADPPSSSSDTGIGAMSLNNSHYPWTDGNIYMGLLSSNRPITYTPVLDLTTLHLMTVTSKTGTNNYKLYHNGIEVAAGTSSSFSLGSGNLHIGASNFSAYVYKGTIYDWFMWNRYLPPEVVYHNYAHPFDLYWQPRLMVPVILSDAAVPVLNVQTAAATAGGLNALTKLPGLSHIGLGGGLSARQIEVNLERTSTVGGLTNVRRTQRFTKASTGAALATLSKKINLDRNQIVGGLSRKVVKSFEAIIAIAGGLAQAAATTVTITLQTAAATAGAIADVVVTYLQFFPPFTGSGGFGARPEGQRRWASWRGTWRRKTGRTR